MNTDSHIHTCVYLLPTTSQPVNCVLQFKNELVKIHPHPWWDYGQANIVLPSPSFHLTEKDWSERQHVPHNAAPSTLDVLWVALETGQHLLNGFAFIADLIHCRKQREPGWEETWTKASWAIWFTSQNKWAFLSSLTDYRCVCYFGQQSERHLLYSSIIWWAESLCTVVVRCCYDPDHPLPTCLV